MVGGTVMELGGNITLSGFSDRDFAEMIVVKKVVGQYARKLHDAHEDFSHLKITLKVTKNQFELHAQAEFDGNLVTSEITDHNLFVGLDSVLKKITAQV